MNQMPGTCPVCSNALHAVRLQCGRCGTGLDGAFALGRLQSLTPEHVRFVETFIKCRGKIKDVEAELEISYPTVVARLNEVVRAMGYEVEEGDLSEVDQFEMYQAQVISPRADMPHVPPMPPRPPVPHVPAPPMPPMPPHGPGAPRMSPEKRQQILDDIAEGKLSISEGMKKLHG